MAVSHIAIILCLLFGSALAQGVSLSVEIWVAVGLVAGVVILVVALIWIVFCIMLYRHQKEREEEEDYHEEVESKKERKKAKKRRQRREERREMELPTTGAENGFDNYPTSEDLWNLSDHDNTRQLESIPSAQDSNLPDSDTQSPEPDTALPSAPEPEPTQPVPLSCEHSDPTPIETKPYTPVPGVFESIFTPPTDASEEENHRRGLHVKLSANVSTSRLRKLSEVEECEVQPDVSNLPLRYGQRRISSTTRPVYDYGSSDPFSFNFGPLVGRNLSQKGEEIKGSTGVVEYEKRPKHITDHKDIMFGQLSSWPEFNNF